MAVSNSARTSFVQEMYALSDFLIMVFVMVSEAVTESIGGGLAGVLLAKGMNTDVIPHGKGRGLMVFHLDHSSNLWIIMRA